MGIYDREEAVERSRRWLKTGSAILISSGMLSIVVPLIARSSLSLALSIALLAAGLGHGTLALGARDRGNSVWLILVSATFFAAAMTLLAKQDIPVTAVALVISASFLIQATAEIAYFAMARPTRNGSTWALGDAIPTIFAAFLICSVWVRNLSWFLETVVGITWIVSGLTWILRSQAFSSHDQR